MRRRGLSRRRVEWSRALGQLLYLDISVMYFPALRLEANVALRRLRVVALVHQFPVEKDGHSAVFAGDLVTIPIAEGNAVFHDYAAPGPLDAAAANAEQATSFSDVVL